MQEDMDNRREEAPELNEETPDEAQSRETAEAVQAEEIPTGVDIPIETEEETDELPAAQAEEDDPQFGQEESPEEEIQEEAETDAEESGQEVQKADDVSSEPAFDEEVTERPDPEEAQETLSEAAAGADDAPEAMEPPVVSLKEFETLPEEEEPEENRQTPGETDSEPETAEVSAEPVPETEATSSEQQADPAETADEGKKKVTGKKDGRLKGAWISWAILPLVLFYYEIVFRQATGEVIFGPQLIAAAAFSLIYGTVLFCLCSLFKNSKVNRLIKAVLIGLTTLPFMVQYYTFRQFKTFYDVRTIIAGTDDVVGGFLNDALKTILNTQGLIRLGLFLLPLVLYIILRKKDPARRFTARLLFRTVYLLILSLGLAAGTVLGIPGMRDDYHRFYNYTNAVNTYGLLTGMRLDITQGGKNNVSFAVEETTPYVKPSTGGGLQNITPEIVEEEPVVYEPNVMDIDFAALAENASEPYKSLDQYVASLTPSMKNEYTGLFEGKNLIMITAEAFSAEVIDEERTPTLYRLANKGIQFTDFTQSATAGTIGGEFQVIFGMPSVRGGASFQDMSANYNCMTMGAQLDRLGYYGIAFHNNDYKYYNRVVTHNSLGYSEGFYGYGNGLEEFITPTWPESDLEMMEGTVDWYIDHQPFNAYYMTVSGHSAYSFRWNDMSAKNEEYVQDMPYSDTVRAYFGANMELEHALTYLVERLEEAGIEDDTVIVICADHFPYGLDNDAALGNMPYLSELYGYDVLNYLDRDHNRLIIWSGCLEDEDPIVVDTPVSSLDILPTLSNLFGLEFDSRVFVGRDVFSDAEPLVFDLFYDWKTEYGRYLSNTGEFYPASEDIEIPEGYVDRIKTIVNNKINYCKGVVDNNYFKHVFEPYYENAD